MNFIQAVTALRDRECKGIKRLDWLRGITYCHFTLYFMGDPQEMWIPNVPDCLADDWELVNPTPKTEEVTIQGFVNPRNNDFYPTHPEYLAEELYTAVLTYSRIIPRKVKKRVELKLKGHAYENILIYPPEVMLPDNANYFAEWEETDG